MTVAYDGTHFCGWQKQPRKRSAQGVLEETLKTITGQEVKVNGASRTDSGVHALGQVADFSLSTSMTAQEFHRAFLCMLPPDLTVKKVSACPPSFSSRKDALSKEYLYTLWNHRVPAPLVRHTALHVHEPLDVKAMQKAASYLRGKKDFASFQTSGSQQKKTRMRVYGVRVSKKGNLIYIRLSSQYFLYKMCRSIVGTLLHVGKGRLKPSELASIIRGKNRSLAGPNVPAQGLCLVRIHYPKNL